jgi:hypothetical protein
VQTSTTTISKNTEQSFVTLKSFLLFFFFFSFLFVFLLSLGFPPVPGSPSVRGGGGDLPGRAARALREPARGHYRRARCREQRGKEKKKEKKEKEMMDCLMCEASTFGEEVK